jgi:lipid-A-disaccharide synthase
VTPRLVVTVNGPGELMGWARPFVRAVYDLDVDTRVTIVFVPCPYATGREPQTARDLFPRATVVAPKQYARFLMGRAVDGMEKGPGALQYLGGDLYHAKTIAKRMGLTSMTYKFSRRNFAHSFVRFFALDEANAAQLRATGAPPDRVRIVGNLVADSVLESVASPPPAPSRATTICIFPGSRPPELRALLPFFLDAVMRVLRARPELGGSVSIAPFNSDDEIRASLQAPDSAFGGVRGELVEGGKTIVVDGIRFAVDRSGRYEALSQAALVIATPGTKCIEAAVLGRPLLVVLPLNRTDEAVVPGMAGYLHRVPVVGRPLKRWLSRKIERRFKYVAQPNIDADKPLVPELRGVLSSQDIAARALSMLADPAALDAMGAELARLYAHDAGAAARMAREALSVAVEAAQPATGAAS